MAQLTAVAGVLVVLAVAAQLRRRHLEPPAPLAMRVDASAGRRADGAVDVVIRGRRGIALSLHGARWPDDVRVLEVEGPLTLVHPADERRYVVRGIRGPDVRIGGLFDQLTWRKFALSVAIAPGGGAGGAEADGSLTSSQRSPVAKAPVTS